MYIKVQNFEIIQFQNSIYSSTIQSLKWDLENAHEIAFILTNTLKEETFAKAQTLAKESRIQLLNATTVSLEFHVKMFFLHSSPNVKLFQTNI